MHTIKVNSLFSIFLLRIALKKPAAEGIGIPYEMKSTQSRGQSTSTINIQDNPNPTHETITQYAFCVYYLCLHVFGFFLRAKIKKIVF